MCHRFTTRFFLHSSLIPDRLVGSRPPYDSTVELGWLMCHGLNANSFAFSDSTRDKKCIV